MPWRILVCVLLNISFAGVFKEAWINAVKLSTMVNAFRGAGIWPVNSDVVLKKVLPSTVYSLATNEVPDKEEVKCDNPSFLATEASSLFCPMQ